MSPPVTGGLRDKLTLINNHLDLQPNDERFLTNRGLIYKDLNEFDLAKEDLTKLSLKRVDYLSPQGVISVRFATAFLR